MADGLENAAVAFDAVIASEPGKSTGRPTAERPAEPLFQNVGELEVDEGSPAKGGGDDDSEEDILYGKQSVKDKADSRNPREGDGPDSEGDDDDESAGEGGADDEDDGSGEAGAEVEEEEAAILGRKVEVTVDGEPVEVSIKEALEGYVRTETFHRRLNQLDEAKKIVRRAAADAVSNYEYSVSIVKQMEEHMNTMIPKEPDWDEEFQKDPMKARELQRYYEKANQFRQQMRAQAEEIQTKAMQSNANQLAAFAEEETAKFEAANRKNWSDPKKKSKDLQSMRKTAISSGFTEDEVSQVYDSRMLNILLKASKYDRMMAAKPKPVVRAQAKPIPPGAGSVKQRTAQKGVSSAMKRLNHTGRLEDAAVVFDQILARG